MRCAMRDAPSRPGLRADSRPPRTMCRACSDRAAPRSKSGHHDNVKPPPPPGESFGSSWLQLERRTALKGSPGSDVMSIQARRATGAVSGSAEENEGQRRIRKDKRGGGHVGPGNTSPANQSLRGPVPGEGGPGGPDPGGGVLRQVCSRTRRGWKRGPARQARGGQEGGTKPAKQPGERR